MSTNPTLFPIDSDPLSSAVAKPSPVKLVGTRLRPNDEGRTCFDCNADTRATCATCGGTGYEQTQRKESWNHSGSGQSLDQGTTATFAKTAESRSGLSVPNHNPTIAKIATAESRPATEPISHRDSAPGKLKPGEPAAPKTQHAAFQASGEKRECVRGMVAALLYAAGRVTVRDSKTLGGMTIQELAKSVSERRGKLTKETTITQPLKDLRGGEVRLADGELLRIDPEYVRDSGHTRMGNDGKPCTVWEHTYIILPMGEQGIEQ